MAEYSATHHPNLHRRRQSSGSIPAPGVHFDAGARSEKSLADKAQEYDRALRQSQIAASRKKAGLATGNTLTASAIGPSASLLFGGPSMAQSAMLGDSQGSIAIQVASSTRTPLAKDETETENTIPLEDLALDGGVGSGLGESYVDGAKRTRQFEDSQTNEDPIEDVGILGLLAQIYGKRDGPVRVIG